MGSDGETRKVVLILEVEEYEERGEWEDGMKKFVLTGMEITCLNPMSYHCFDTLDDIWFHIGSRLCRSKSSAIAASIDRDASALCTSIQQLVHESGGDSPDGEPIRVTFTLQLFFYHHLQEETQTRTSLKRKRSAMDDHDNQTADYKLCVICLDELAGEEGSSFTMPCNHEFHEKCIAHWLERAHTCPICRFKLD